jgi:enoyl-CoA hydratase
VAAVNGFALGGGCELALACHFIYASEKCKSWSTEVNLGCDSGYGGTQRLTQIIGRNRAMELLMSGNIITAKEAMEYGMVNKVSLTTDESDQDKRNINNHPIQSATCCIKSY